MMIGAFHGDRFRSEHIETTVENVVDRGAEMAAAPVF
jgi:hypothetical protein